MRAPNIPSAANLGSQAGNKIAAPIGSSCAAHHRAKLLTPGYRQRQIALRVDRLVPFAPRQRLPRCPTVRLA
jgi:hypothetical protein